MSHPRPVLVARQGDVGIVRHAGIVPAQVVPADPDGSAVVAHGEVTGHRHRFAPDQGVTLRCEQGDDLASRLLVEAGAGGATLRHEEHGPIVVESGDACVRQVEYRYGTASRVED